MLALATAAPADAITSKRARQIALKNLKPNREPGSVALFALRRPVRARASVAEGGVRGAIRGRRQRLAGVRLRRPAYLFWLDRQYGAQFAHPSTLLLIDAKTGRRIARRDMLWPPLVNGRPTAFTRTPAGYRSSRNKVFRRVLRLRQPPRLRRAPTARAAQSQVPAGYFARDCMVMIGDRLNPTFRGNFTVMKRWADGVGLANSYAVSAADLRNDVTVHTRAGCNDVLIYLTGHGLPPKNWVDHKGQTWPGAPEATVDIGGRFVFDDKRGATSFRGQTITATDLDGIMKAFPNVGFKLKIDSCFSGRFLPLLGANPNLLIIEVSSKDDQPSQGYLADAKVEKDGKLVPWSEVADNRDGATEFTNGNVHGLAAWSRSADEIRDHPGLVGALARSLTLGHDFNGAAWIPPGDPGHADPQVQVNPVPPGLGGAPPPQEPAPTPPPPPPDDGGGGTPPPPPPGCSSDQGGCNAQPLPAGTDYVFNFSNGNPDDEFLFQSSLQVTELAFVYNGGQIAAIDGRGFACRTGSFNSTSTNAAWCQVMMAPNVGRFFGIRGTPDITCQSDVALYIRSAGTLYGPLARTGCGG